MLAQLGTVKTRLGMLPSDTQDDAQLTSFIKLTSARFAQDCRRVFERTAGATYTFRASECLVIPDRLPIEAVTAWEVKATEADGWETVTDADFLIGPGNTTVELMTALGSSAELARVTYTGGYVLPGTTPTAGQTALPDDLEQCCIEQVCYLWQNRNRLGLVSMGGQGGSLAQFAELDLLPMVRQTLNGYIRMTI